MAMETLQEPAFDRQLLISLRNNVLDLDAEVDCIRLAIDDSVERLKVAVQRRDDVASQLARLISQVAV